MPSRSAGKSNAGTLLCQPTTTTVGTFLDSWLLPGNYWYKVTFGGGTYGPFPVTAAVPSSTSGVSSFNTRSGAVTLTSADVDAVGAITNNTSGNANTATTSASATSATTATTATNATTAANATGINGASVPPSQSCVGTNGSGQIITGSCGGGSSLNVLQTTLGSSTTLSVGASCSPTTPCNVRVGGSVYAFTAPGNVSLSGATGSTNTFAYVTTAGVLTIGYAGAGVTLSCTSGCTATSGITSVPAGAVPLSSTATASNAFGTITDLRPLSVNRQLLCRNWANTIWHHLCC